MGKGGVWKRWNPCFTSGNGPSLALLSNVTAVCRVGGAGRAPHVVPRSARGFRGAQLPHDRRLQRQRCSHPLPVRALPPLQCRSSTVQVQEFRAGWISGLLRAWHACRAEPATCKTIDSSCMLLVDSGGQYNCGTTDITRTFHFGTPSSHQKDCYTRVLQVHACLSCMLSATHMWKA